MSEEVTKQSTRYRINVSISTKGVKTWDCTVDSDYFTLEETLVESDRLVGELEKRYPIIEA